MTGWAYTSIVSDYRILMSYNGYGYPDLILAYDDYCGSPEVLSIIYLPDASYSDDCVGPPITPNTWIFYAVTYNGPLQRSVTYQGNGGTLNYHSNTEYLFANAISSYPQIDFGFGGGGWYGGASNLQIYDKDLSVAQVQQIYSRGINGAPLMNNLIGWWPLNGDTNEYSGADDITWLQDHMTFPYLKGASSSIGPSTVTSYSNEWQVLGLANPGP